MIDFGNTEVAFRIRSKAEMRKAKFLFGTIKHRGLVGFFKKATALALQLRLPIDWLVKSTLYVQFVGGETLEDSDQTAQKLAKFRVSSILDYSVEGKDDEQSIQECFDEILRGIEFGGKRGYVAFAVFKPTGITFPHVLEKVSAGLAMSDGDRQEFSRFVERVDALCKKSAQVGLPLLVDAEDYCYQKAIDEVVEQMMARYNTARVVVYNTLQMYRKDRFDYLKELHLRAKQQGFKVGVKFVRGAYMEKERQRAMEMDYPSPINDSKQDTDSLFDEGLIYTMEHINDFAIFAGTHNEDSNRLLVELVYKYGLDTKDSRVWFSQLYGMSDNISFNLAAEGFNVAKYLPYGPVKEVLPYLMRRAAENTSVAGQTSRELNFINVEIGRRKIFGQW